MSVIVESSDLRARVEKALDQIRPYLRTDGGDVEVIEITSDFILKLQLLGSCGSCPMSMMTLKAGVEETVRKEVPEIKGIVAVSPDQVNSGQVSAGQEGAVQESSGLLKGQPVLKAAV